MNLNICFGDVDWFKVSVGAGETRTLRAQILFAASQGDLDLYLYREESDGGVTELMRSTGSTGLEQVAASAPSAGTYLLRVVGFNGATNSYGLQVGFGP
jgi:hypothetical protein